MVAFSSLWLCASAHKAFRFRQGVDCNPTVDLMFCEKLLNLNERRNKLGLKCYFILFA
jgi:hypothetical protein